MLPFKSPQVSSTSHSSSEADDEDADGESSGEPPGAPKEDEALENGSPRADESKVDTPPPSYPAQQVRSSVYVFCFFLCVFPVNRSKLCQFQQFLKLEL